MDRDGNFTYVNDAGHKIFGIEAGKIIGMNSFQFIHPDDQGSTKEMGDQKGMGLGLAVSHSIIKKHDGYIFVDSEVGKGTNVTIFLPAE